MKIFEIGIAAKVEKEFERKKDTLVAEIEVRIAQSEARLTLRMFYFWIGQVAILSGILAYFFKFATH